MVYWVADGMYGNDRHFLSFRASRTEGQLNVPKGNRIPHLLLTRVMLIMVYWVFFVFLVVLLPCLASAKKSLGL